MGRRIGRPTKDTTQKNIIADNSKEKQIIYMIISLVIAVFVGVQVYYLVLYTLGYDVDMGSLWLYTLVSNILN